MPFDVLSFIAAKRDGMEHPPGEIEGFVFGLLSGEVADYQASAWLMAAFLRGLSMGEVRALTEALARSGRALDLSSLGRRAVDKHSTGGVGDKATLVVVPTVASLGVPVAKLSGRGLDFTGGTADKLESIPGFRVSLSAEELLKQLSRIGCCMASHSSDLAPAEALLYHLRDVTATVPSIPLIASSIVSKKLAAGASAFVFDVKWGEGAFMADLEGARSLARVLVSLSRELGREAVAVLSRMDRPLGRAVGNALEVVEALELLRGEGPGDLRELCLELGGWMAFLGGVCGSPEEGKVLCEEAIRSGRALKKMAQLIEAQGGDPKVVENPRSILEGLEAFELRSEEEGYLSAIRARRVGLAVRALGGGRVRKEDPIDLQVGLVLEASVGDRVERGDPLARVFYRDGASLQRALELLDGAFVVSPEAVEVPPVVTEVVG